MFYKFSLTPVKASPGHSSCKGVGVDPDSVSRAMYTPHRVGYSSWLLQSCLLHSLHSLLGYDLASMHPSLCSEGVHMSGQWCGNQTQSWMESLSVKPYRKTSTKLLPDVQCGTSSRGPTSHTHINTARSRGWAAPAAQPLIPDVPFHFSFV